MTERVVLLSCYNHKYRHTQSMMVILSPLYIGRIRFAIRLVKFFTAALSARIFQ